MMNSQSQSQASAPTTLAAAFSFAGLLVLLGACGSEPPVSAATEATRVTQAALEVDDQTVEDTSPDDPSDPVDSTLETGSLDVAPSDEDVAASGADGALWGAAAPAPARTGVLLPRGVGSADGVAAVESAAAAKRCASPSPLTVYPVRDKHDTGYQRSPSSDASGNWTCGSAHSNTDFVRHGCSDSSSHFGVDIWAKRGAPVVAAVSGTVAESKWSDYSGNVVTIQDACGWWHFNIHMKDRTVKKGAKVVAGQLIGHVSNTGTASNGVVHLHYSSYPGSGNYCEGKDPWGALHKVEKDVCWTPVICQGKACAKGQKCSYFGSTLMCN